MIIVSIILLSVLSGIIYSIIGHNLDLKNYPRPNEYAAFVSVYSEKYAVPEHVIYGVIKYESDFNSSNVGTDGGIGLMGVSKEEFAFLMKLNKESLSEDALYGPETNIKYGTMLLSYLYSQCEDWSWVFAAKNVTMDIWESWLSDSGNFDEEGNFTGTNCTLFKDDGEKIRTYSDKYTDLYYED